MLQAEFKGHSHVSLEDKIVKRHTESGGLVFEVQ